MIVDRTRRRIFQHQFQNQRHCIMRLDVLASMAEEGATRCFDYVSSIDLAHLTLTLRLLGVF